MQPLYLNIFYFNGLNALRFVAAFLVLLQHAATLTAKRGWPNLSSYSFFSNGHNAVIFFFVLSGFLITYLLLKEVAQTNTVQIKRFYLKRVFRIWPLYYLLVAIGLLVLPFLLNNFNIQYELPYRSKEVWFYFIFFVPGLVTHFFGHHFLEPLWSIGVEEVFYLLWAPLIKIFKKHIAALLWSVLIIKILLLSFVQAGVITNATWTYLIQIHSFDAMAIGGLGAYWLFTRKTIIEAAWLFKKPIRYIVYAALLLFLSVRFSNGLEAWLLFFERPIYSDVLLCMIYLYTIISVAQIEKAEWLNHKWLNFLGDISYGIYMYHVLVIGVLIQVSLKLGLATNLFSLVLIIVASGGLTICLAGLSKKYFENRFLAMKK